MPSRETSEPGEANAAPVTPCAFLPPSRPKERHVQARSNHPGRHVACRLAAWRVLHRLETRRTAEGYAYQVKKEPLQRWKGPYGIAVGIAAWLMFAPLRRDRRARAASPSDPITTLSRHADAVDRPPDRPFRES